MPHKYVVKTKTGSLYSVEDHRHLLKGSQWLLINQDGTFHIISLNPPIDRGMKQADIKDFLGRSILFGETPNEELKSQRNTSRVVEIYQKIF